MSRWCEFYFEDYQQRDDSMSRRSRQSFLARKKQPRRDFRRALEPLEPRYVLSAVSLLDAKSPEALTQLEYVDGFEIRTTRFAEPGETAPVFVGYDVTEWSPGQAGTGEEANRATMSDEEKLDVYSSRHQSQGQEMAPFNAAIGLNFEAQTRNDSGFIPPDTMGAVGPEHIVELINGAYAVYNKLDGSELFSSSLNAFWTAAGVSFESFTFDPRIHYDDDVGRFYAASVDDARDNNQFLFAISNSSNPLDGWTGWGIDTDSSNGRWADYPQMGYDADGVYISANMFDIDGGAALSTERTTLILPKNDLLVGSIANRTLIEDHSSETGFSAQPVVYKNDPTGGLPSVMIATIDGDTMRVGQISGNINSPTISFFSDFAMTNRNAAGGAEQPNDTGITALETGGRRTSSKVDYWNGAYWTVHTVADPVTGNNSLRFLEVTSAGLVVSQEIFITHPTLDLFYPSIAVSGADGSEDLVIGFSASGPNAGQFVSSYAVIGDTAGGNTTFSSPFLLRAGTATYESLDNSGRNRWGDYSATVVDPEDPRVFWTFQEYAIGNTTWATSVTQIILDGPPFSEVYLELNPFGNAAMASDLFAAADVDTFVFASDVSGSTQINVVESDANFDAGLRLWNLDDLALVDADLNSGGGDDPQIVADIVFWDLYSAEVFSENAFAAYDITVDGPIQPLITPALDANGDATINGDINANPDTDYYSFQAPLTANGNLSLDLTSAAALDSVLTLYDSAGMALARSDSTGLGGNENIAYAGIVAGETYYVRVGSYRYASNDTFVLDVDFSTYLPTAWTGVPESYVVISSTGGSNNVVEQNALLDFAGDVDSYYLAGDSTWTGDYTITIGDMAGAPDPVLAIYDDSGTLIAAANDGGIDDDAQVTVSLNGLTRYIVALADYTGTQTGDMTLNVSTAFTSNPGTIAINPATGFGQDTGELIDSNADTDFYRFTAPPGASGAVAVTVRPTSGTLDAAVFMVDIGSGNELARSVFDGGAGTAEILNYNSVIPLTTYEVSVLGHDFSSSGPFDIEVQFRIDDGLTDFDNDGNYDCDDVDALVEQIALGPYDPTFDLNSDSTLDVADLEFWLAAAAGHNGLGSPYRFGDANLDGGVDVSDFNVWNANKFSNIPAWCSGDFNADGVVDISDFNLWNANKFTMSDAQPLLNGPANEFFALPQLSQNGLIAAAEQSADLRSAVVDSVFAANVQHTALAAPAVVAPQHAGTLRPGDLAIRARSSSMQPEDNIEPLEVPDAFWNWS